MAIEIREIIIRAVTDANGSGSKKKSNRAGMKQEQQDILNVVTEIIKNDKER